MMLRYILMLALCWGILAAGPCLHANAAVAYDEEVDGDLSGDYTTPTVVFLLPGSNEILASTGVLDSGDDLEYVNVAVPVGYRLSELRLLSYEGRDLTAFIGLQSGTEFTFHADDAFSHINDMLGWSHIGPGAATPVGSDLLPAIAQNGQTFVPPLGGSAYTFWIQQTGAITDYRLDFVVTPVPEPASCLLAASMLLIVATRRSSRRFR